MKRRRNEAKGYMSWELTWWVVEQIIVGDRPSVVVRQRDRERAPDPEYNPGGRGATSARAHAANDRAGVGIQ